MGGFQLHIAFVTQQPELQADGRRMAPRSETARSMLPFGPFYHAVWAVLKFSLGRFVKTAGTFSHLMQVDYFRRGATM